MNEYHAIARQYFQRVEGWHLYRVRGDRLLWVWLVLVVAWMVSFIPLLSTIGNWSRYWMWLVLVLALEVVVLIVGGAIQKRKSDALSASVKQEMGVQIGEEDECRALLLEKLINRPRHEFLAAAKEISDLLELREEFRSGQELETGFFRRHVYDPDSKARVLALTLAAITLATALTLRAAPEGLAILELFDSPGLLRAIGTVVLICAGAFLAAVGLRAILQVVWGAATIWAAKTVSSKKSVTALRRLARDLVLLHSLKKPSEAQGDGRGAASNPPGGNAADRADETIRLEHRYHFIHAVGLGALIGWAAIHFLSRANED